MLSIFKKVSLMVMAVFLGLSFSVSQPDMRRDERKHDHADSEDRRTPDRREHDDEK